MIVAENSSRYPKIICEKCSLPMDVIGVGSSSGRLNYHCAKCGGTYWGKNLAAMQMGSLGGKARAEALSAEERSDQARKAVESRWRKIKQT